MGMGMSIGVDTDVFEDMFEASDDPWAFRTSWYEERKRLLTLACLPAQRYPSAYEPGCANGELSAALATRCDQLLVSDGAAAAVTLARQRLAALPHVQVVRASTPNEWPQGRFDLVVVSELGYYLSKSMLTRLASNARLSLTDTGVLVACHWRQPIAGCEMTGDEVHAVLGDRLAMHRLAHHTEADFVMDVWSIDNRSVAGRGDLAGPK